MSAKWEYLVESVPVANTREVAAGLNKLGDQGWEVIVCLSDPADPRWVFVFSKRPKPD